jgi:hypothetical protein
MDNIWQQHKDFILKILGGLGVLLVFWIIWSSLTSESVADVKELNEGKAERLAARPVPDRSTIAAFQSAVEKLKVRVQNMAARVGEVRKGEDLRIGLIHDILNEIGKGDDESRRVFDGLARSSPKACLSRLKGAAVEYLVGRAGLSNVLLDEGLGLERLTIQDAEVDRYLIALDLIIKVVEIGIEEEVYEIKNISIGTPPGGRFEGTEVFLREYPVNMKVRGPSANVLRFIERLSDPERFIPVDQLRSFAPERSEREQGVVVADLDLMALAIDPDSPIAEGR